MIAHNWIVTYSYGNSCVKSNLKVKARSTGVRAQAKFNSDEYLPLNLHWIFINSSSKCYLNGVAFLGNPFHSQRYTGLQLQWQNNLGGDRHNLYREFY